MLHGRTLALISEMRAIHQSYPFRLFLLLLREVTVDQVMQEECMWDDWTRGFVDYWSASEGGLASDACLCDLQVVVIVLQCDTVPIECAHASLRRALVILSAQTHIEKILMDCRIT